MTLNDRIYIQLRRHDLVVIVLFLYNTKNEDIKLTCVIYKHINMYFCTNVVMIVDPFNEYNKGI